MAKRSDAGEAEVEWNAVIARCLAFLCLQQSEFKNDTKLAQAEFLSCFGLPAGDRADLTGSTTNSLRVLAQQAQKKKGGKKNGKGKRR